MVIGLLGAIILAKKGIRPEAVLNSIHASSPSKRFHDSQFGVTFQYPKEWEQQYVSPNIVLFSGKNVTMTLVLSRRKEAETLEQFTKKNSEEIIESSRNAGFVVDMEQARPLLLSSLPAQKISYHTKKEGVLIDGIQVWTVEKKMEYIITFAAPSEQFGAAVQTFDNVLQSVRISPGKE